MSDGEKEEGDMHAKRAVEGKREEEIFFAFLSHWEVDNYETEVFIPLVGFFAFEQKSFRALRPRVLEGGVAETSRD